MTSSAVPSSRVPTSAERRTREASSCGVRAPDSSSWGVMPTVRSTRLAEPLSTMISGRVRTENTRTGTATTRAVRSGAEMPRNCGSSSPKTMENTVATTSARPAETASTAGCASPSRVSGPLSSRPTEGWAR